MSLIQVGFGENPQEALFGKCKLLKLRLGPKKAWREGQKIAR
jgi:hypothetical protein